MKKIIKHKRHITIVALAIAMMTVLSFAIGYDKEAVYADPASYETQVASLYETATNVLPTDAGVNTDLIASIQNEGYLDENSIIFQTYESADVTVSANGYKSVTISSDVSKDGYTAKGVLGYWIANSTSGGQGSTYCTMNRYYLSGNTVTAVIRNTNTTNDAKVYIGVGVLYVKNN